MIGSLHLLLIEDEADLAALIREFLSLLVPGEVQLTWVATLARGLAVLEQGGLDLVLMDLSLPDSHGLETLHAVRRLAQGVPVVVMSGQADEQLAADALAAGARLYLVKGKIPYEELVERILAVAGEARGELG